MFNQYQIKDVCENFVLEEINMGIRNIDMHVEEQWLGSLKEAKEKELFGQSISKIIELEGYFVIPMGYSGIAFDYGDTSSNGISLVDCVPYGESKELFKEKLLNNLLSMRKILEDELIG